MLPQQFKEMFGLKDEKDMNMANNIWKMLDEMAESNPDNYKKFIQKNVQEGFQDVKQKKQEKDKPYKIVPAPGFALKMSADLKQKMYDEPSINEKVTITKEKWSQVHKRFSPKINIIANVCHSDRVKRPIKRSTKKEIQFHHLAEIKDIELFYYSFQGPLQDPKQPSTYYVCMILNSKFYQDIVSQNGGRKVLMGLAVSYLQERLMADKNPLLSKYNPEEHRKLAYYNIEKMSIQIPNKEYVFLDKFTPGQFMLEFDIDIKRIKVEEQKKKKEKQASKPVQKQQIKFKQDAQVSKKQQTLLPVAKQQQKKVLIEVLKQQEIEGKTDTTIPYQMKQSEEGYHFEFLLKGINSIEEIDLQISSQIIKIKTKDDRFLEIKLGKTINTGLIKAKLKKKINKLLVDAYFH